MSETHENQQLKEQVRIKNTELKKERSERAKQEEKVQFLQESIQKRLKNLQARIDEQEEEIRYYQNRGTDLYNRVEDGSKEQSAENQDENPEALFQKERYLKTLQFLKELKTKNDRLGLKLDHEQKERDRLTKEKGILAREIKRLQKDPNAAINPNLRSSAHELESRMEEARARYEHLLKEKDMMISSYEAAIHAATNSGEASPSAIKNLAQNLEELRKEKAGLENTLERERKFHKSKFNRQIAQLEVEITQRLKRKLNRKKRGQIASPEGESGSQTSGWITTYADLATLLMTFFVLYYSLGQMDIQEIRDEVEKGGSPEKLQSVIKSQQKAQSLEVAVGLRPNQIVREVQKLTERLKNQADVEMPPGGDKIFIKLPGETLFASGSADLELQKSREALEEIVKVANKYSEYKIQIKGHTDDVPIDSVKFPTNWELSTARGAAVLRYFLDKNITAERLSASGYADTFPLADNNTEQGRKLNRRVEIVLEKEE